MSTRHRFRVADLEVFPNDGRRYEVIDGELFVSTAPHLRHQYFLSRLHYWFAHWDFEARHGIVLAGAGIVFSDETGVIPDLVWVSQARAGEVLGEDGKLHAAPDLVVEVLSPGADNERRDREVKLDLFSRQGVREYWIVSREARQILVYRRGEAGLTPAATLGPDDQLTSPWLPGFSASVADLFSFPHH